jgi:hypothetical integral membrane protein (TIGR02206 family)
MPPMPPLALLLAATVLAWTGWRLFRRDFSAREHLPLDLCNLSALLALGHGVTGSPLLTAWMVCFAAPGALVSMATPDLDERHDLATRVKFWIVHPGLAVFGIGAALTLPPSGGLRTLAQLWILLAGYAAVVAVLDHWLGANYLFLRHKPATPSLLDRFGPWPVYLVPLTGTVAATMLLAFIGWTWIWE